MLLLRKILLKVLLVARYQRFVQFYMYVSAIGRAGIAPYFTIMTRGNNARVCNRQRGHGVPYRQLVSPV